MTLLLCLRQTPPVTRPEDTTDALVQTMVRVCRDLGLRVDAPDVLNVGANLVVHLAPSPVVARVATLTADMRGGAVDYLRREYEITASLKGRGIDVVGPTDLVDPGPHLADGRAFLLLEHRDLRPVDLASVEDATAVGEALAELTMVLADLPNEVASKGQGQPWAEMATLIAQVAADHESAAIGRISDAVSGLRATEPTDHLQLVHGDAHKTNVAWSGDRVIWFDFEDANRRPLAWDLATLRRSWPAAGDVACRVLGVDPGDESMLWHHELREVYALLWSLLYAQRFEASRAPAAARLADWLNRQPPTGV